MRWELIWVAATGPGQGSVVGDSVPFKEQVSTITLFLPIVPTDEIRGPRICSSWKQAHGYAKKFHGMFTGNKEEKAYGEEVIKGQAN